MEIRFASSPPADGALALAAFEEELAGLGAETLDRLGRSGGRFKATAGSVAVLQSPRTDGAPLLIVGAGPREKFGALPAERWGGHALAEAVRQGAGRLALDCRGVDAATAARTALGARLAAYRFHVHRSRLRDGEDIPVTELLVVSDDPGAARQAYAPLAALGDGVLLTRDLVSEPANVLHPGAFAERMKALAGRGLEVEILGEAALRELGAGALLGVGLGSPHETCLAVLQWRGAADPSAPPIAFVGKGVTFDTGGTSIKPAQGMEEMKADMGGAAAIAGAMLALAAGRAPVNAVGILCIVENAIGGEAMRPGDILTAMSGRTIEVINTDAEGRLALADGLWYCRQRFKPRAMVDVATLTGAVMIALGLDYGGLYTEDDALAAALLSAGEAEGEPLWRLPMPESYDRHIESLAADVKNVAVGIGRAGGASIAARFLKPFAGDGPWAHLDISGPAWPSAEGGPTTPPGASGYGARLLHRLASSLDTA